MASLKCMTAKSYAGNDLMRTDFDDDPEDGRNNLPYYLYGLVFLVGLAMAIAIGWFLHLENWGANVP